MAGRPAGVAFNRELIIAEDAIITIAFIITIIATNLTIMLAPLQDKTRLWVVESCWVWVDDVVHHCLYDSSDIVVLDIIRAWSPVVVAAGRSCCSVHAWYALVCMCGRLLSITTAQPGACRWERQRWPGVVDSYWVWVTINDSRPLLPSASLLAGLTQWWELYLVAMGLVTVANTGSSNSEDKNSEDTKS